MLATELLIPRALPAPEQGSPGDRLLLATGLAVELGPGLVAGGPVLERVFARLEAALSESLRAVGAQSTALPASEGEALVNLALHAGPLAGSSRSLFCLGTGFREEARGEDGFGGLALYRRLDAVSLAEQGGRAAPGLLDALRATVTRLGLPEITVADDEALLLEGRGVGRVQAREVAVEGGASLEVGMLGLDLHALLAGIIDRHHDGEGLCWPAPLAPFDVGILPGAADDRVSRERAEKLHRTLERAGLAVLLDDREQRPADARRALRGWGLPAAVLFGPGLPADQVLLELRTEGAPVPVPEDALLAKLGVKPAPRGASRATRANY